MYYLNNKTWEDNITAALILIISIHKFLLTFYICISTYQFMKDL